MPDSDIRKLFIILKNNNKEPIKRKYNLIINKSNKGNKLMKPQFKSKLPRIIDLRKKFPPVCDQGRLASCTACALCGLIQYFIPKLQGSRLFVYYNERKLENDIPDDCGSTLTTGMECLKKYGVCPETLWPYNPSKFAVKPTDNCYKYALKYVALDVDSIDETMINLKSYLASGYPFVIGIKVYESFESKRVAQTGIVSMPNINKEQLLGGHAIVCVGYNDTTQQWIMRNSWGNSWGVKGYFYLPYAYLLDDNLSSDTWTIIKLK